MSALAQYEALIEHCTIQSPEKTPELYSHTMRKQPVPKLDIVGSKALLRDVEDLKRQLRRIVGDFADARNFPIRMHDYAVIDEAIDEAFYHEREGM